MIDRFLDFLGWFMEPVNRSLVLMISTVFSVGCQVTLWYMKADFGLSGLFVALCLLWAAKNIPTYRREIEEYNASRNVSGAVLPPNNGSEQS